jgi:hypothetical protein
VTREAAPGVLVLQRIKVEGAVSVRCQDANPPGTACRRDIVDVGPQHHGEVEQGSRGGTYCFGVVDVNAGAGEDHRVCSGGIRRAQYRSGVAGIADLAQNGDEAGTGVEHFFQRDVQEPADRNDALGVDGIGHGGQDLVGGKPGVRSFGQLLEFGKPVQAGSACEHFGDQAGDSVSNALLVELQRFANRLGSLSQELPAL